VNKYTIGFMLIGILALAGCAAGNSVGYVGKSDHWTVSCAVDSSGKTKRFEIRYSGEEKEVKSIGYAFAGSEIFDEAGTTESEGKKVVISGKSTLVDPAKNEEGFEITMKWNGREETIPIQRVEKRS